MQHAQQQKKMIYHRGGDRVQKVGGLNKSFLYTKANQNIILNVQNATSLSVSEESRPFFLGPHNSGRLAASLP